MDSHLTSQSSTIFRSVHSLIYIFDAESSELLSSDTHYFLKCLAALKDQNPFASSTTTSSTTTSPLLSQQQNDDPFPSSSSSSSSVNKRDEAPTIFILLHKMDLVPVGQEASKLAEFSTEVRKRAIEAGWNADRLHFFGTSIWNETLYKVRIPILFCLPSSHPHSSHSCLPHLTSSLFTSFRRLAFTASASSSRPMSLFLFYPFLL